MKKILFITSNFLPSKLGGSEEFVRLLTKLLSKDFEITVLTHRGRSLNYWWNPFVPKYCAHEKIDRINVVRLKNNHLKNFFIVLFKTFFKIIGESVTKKFFSKNFIDYINLYIGPQFLGLKNFLNTNKFDIIHTGPLPYEYPIYVANIVKKLNLKSKLITTPFFHETQKIYYSQLFLNFFELCDTIHVVTLSEKNTLKKAFNLPYYKIKTVPLFLDLDEFVSDVDLEKETIKFKKKYNIIGKIVVLGFNRGGLESKGIEYTVRALNQIANKNNNLCLIILGDEISSQKIYTAQNMKIIEIGYVNKKEKDIIFSVCDIYSMPSQIESFGLMYLEAWLRKKPVLGFALNPLKEVLNQGAVLCEIQNQKDVTMKLMRLINNIEYRNDLGVKGYKFLKDKFTTTALKEKYIKLFE